MIPHLGIDVCPDETGTTVVVLDSRGGTGWVKAAVKGLARQYPSTLPPGWDQWREHR